MKKRGAIHVDWVISMSIFLIYLIVLLVLIKPSYKAEFEGDVLTNMIKDEFLRQNKIDAGFVVFSGQEQCVDGGSLENKLGDKLPVSINDGNIYVNGLASPYRAYFINDVIADSEYEIPWCVEDIGEVVNYTGFVQVLNFDVNKNNFVNRFPKETNYKITEYPSGTEVHSTEEPLDNDEVYVLEFAGSKLFWDEEKIKRENVIINIKVW